jgi:predicted nuclease with TOPRIM domain
VQGSETRGRQGAGLEPQSEIEDFREKLEELQEEFERLTSIARNLEDRVAELNEGNRHSKANVPQTMSKEAISPLS